LAGVIDHAIRFWEVQTGEKLLDIKLDKDVLSIIGFSPDGHFLVTAKRASDLADKVMLWGIPGK